MQKHLFYLVSLSLFILAPLQVHAEEKVIQFSSLTYPPYSYAEKGKTAGMAIDIVREAFASQGYQIAVDLMPWSRALTSAKKGKVDGIFMIYKTDERMNYLIYSQEVLLPEVVSFFKHAGSPITFDGSLESIEGLRISVVNQIWYGKKLDAAIKNEAFNQLRRSPSLEEALMMLSGRRTDLVPGNRDVIYQTLARMPELKNLVEVKPELDALPSYVAFTKKRDLTAARDAFDAGIRQIRESGRYDEIIRSHTPEAQK